MRPLAGRAASPRRPAPGVRARLAGVAWALLAWAALGGLGPPALALTLDLPGAAAPALRRSEALGSHRLATGPWAEGVLPTRRVEGAIQREAFRIEGSGLSTLQLLAPLREQLAAQGFETRLDCEAEACGGFDFRAGIEVLPPPAMFVDLADFRYLSAEGDGEAVSLLVSRSDGAGFVQVVRVTLAEPSAAGRPAEVGPEAGPEGPPPLVPAETTPAPPVPSNLSPASPPPLAGLAERLESEGRVVLEGLAFATGSADLAPGGEAALGALAAYLAANPARRLALVGHTDAQGPLEANVSLSRRRAEAVAERLVAAHGVARAQLRAEGMGWLAPRATNLSSEGREANRRVEAVVLP